MQTSLETGFPFQYNDRNKKSDMACIILKIGKSLITRAFKVCLTLSIPDEDINFVKRSDAPASKGGKPPLNKSSEISSQNCFFNFHKTFFFPDCHFFKGISGKFSGIKSLTSDHEQS